LISTLLSNACATRINVPIIKFRGSFSIAEIFGALISAFAASPGNANLPIGVRAFRRFFRYPEAMQHVTISLPDELLAAFSAQGQDLSRAALEALALEAYRTRKISAAQLRRLLGLHTRIEVDAFLKDHGVELEYTLEDLERDRETHRQLGS
jgi:hypothetical protein